MPSIDVCPRCHGDGILRSTGDGTLRRKGDGTALRRSGGAIDCPHCGGLGRLVSVTDAGKAGQISESLRAMMWPYTIHLQLAQRELFEATVLTLLQELPPGTIGPGTVTQACRTAQRQVLKGEVQRKGARF
jgi:hypothetical protein